MSIDYILSIFSIFLLSAGFCSVIFSSYFKKKENLSIFILFLCVFFSLVILNFLGYNTEMGEDTHPVFRIGTAIGITMTMFGHEYDGGYAGTLARENIVYGIAITFSYISALFCTVIFIMQVFFKGVKNSFRVCLNARGFSGRTIIIAGINRFTEMVLESLSESEKRCVTIILDTDDPELKKECLVRGLTIIAEKLNEETLAKAGLFNSGKQGEKIFISLLPSDEQNLTAARSVTLGMKNNPDAEFKAYIMYTEIDRAEHFKFSEEAKGKIQFFNPHEKTARYFLSRWPASSLVPKDYIDTSSAAMKKNYRIGHIFAGFGKANIQMLKKSLIIDQLPKCDYRALAVDIDIENNAAIFKNSSRGLFRKQQTQEEKDLFFPSPDEKCDIEFVSLNINSREFYEKAIEEIKSNDFTVITAALGEDKLTAETAMEIRQWAYENDIPPEKIKIFIKAINHSALSEEDVLNPEGSASGGCGEIRIEPFGFEEDIYNFNAIIDEDMDMLAKHIAENYSGGGSGSKWELLINHERDSNRYAALSIKPKLNLMGFDLIFDNDIEHPLQAAQDSAVVEAFEKAYANLQVQENLARYEHQRWNLYYLVSGWQPLPKAEVTASGHKNIRKRKHACLTTFEGLEELARIRGELAGKDFSNFDTRPYDYDLMNNLLGNIKDTKYRIVRLAD